MKCWMTIGLRDQGECSYCSKKGDHRVVAFSTYQRIPTPRVSVTVCDECWLGNEKFETPPAFFPPERAVELPLRAV
jgi:hypothetical protein